MRPWGEKGEGKAIKIAFSALSAVVGGSAVRFRRGFSLQWKKGQETDTDKQPEPLAAAASRLAAVWLEEDGKIK